MYQNSVLITIIMLIILEFLVTLIDFRILTINLFVTSKNQSMNSRNHKFTNLKCCKWPESLLKPLFNGVLCLEKTFKPCFFILKALKDILQHFNLWIRGFSFFDVTNRLNVHWFLSVSQSYARHRNSKLTQYNFVYLCNVSAGGGTVPPQNLESTQWIKTKILFKILPLVSSALKILILIGMLVWPHF